MDGRRSIDRLVKDPEEVTDHPVRFREKVKRVVLYWSSTKLVARQTETLSVVGMMNVSTGPH